MDLVTSKRFFGGSLPCRALRLRAQHVARTAAKQPFNQTIVADDDAAAPARECGVESDAVPDSALRGWFPHPPIQRRRAGGSP